MNMSSIEPCKTDYESGCRIVLYVGCGFEFIILSSLVSHTVRHFVISAGNCIMIMTRKIAL